MKRDIQLLLLQPFFLSYSLSFFHWSAFFNLILPCQYRVRCQKSADLLCFSASFSTYGLYEPSVFLSIHVDVSGKVVHSKIKPFQNLDCIFYIFSLFFLWTSNMVPSALKHFLPIRDNVGGTKVKCSLQETRELGENRHVVKDAVIFFFFFSSACDCLITGHFWIGSCNQLLRVATLLDGGACCQNPLSSLYEETDSWITVEWAAQSLGQLIPLCEKSNPGSIRALGESDWRRHGGALVAPLALHRISGQ